MDRVIYPGSFCPFTLGHVDIVERSQKLAKLVIIAIMNNSLKSNQMFSIEERTDMLKELYAKDIEDGRIMVISSNKATVDCALEYNCSHIIRGIRGFIDFNAEIEMAFTNRELSDNSLDTIFLMASLEHTYTSASNVRERLKYNKPVKHLLPSLIYDKIVEQNTHTT